MARFFKIYVARISEVLVRGLIFGIKEKYFT